MKNPPSLIGPLINFIVVELNCSVILMGGDDWFTLAAIYLCLFNSISTSYTRIRVLRQNIFEELAE